ncbi:hypothetical protein [Burkholderia sp. CCA53]|uniref:hypothetical protein n=1 Tax=Burkholderia sp. CCA53 TaxID=1776288 RepID=UPI0020C7BC91|nr:hypothetical protein [Burkholderia sp. CCA53]
MRARNDRQRDCLKARDIEAEKTKPSPNSDRIDELRRQQAELADERSRLRIGDHDAVARAIEQYGRLVARKRVN